MFRFTHVLPTCACGTILILLSALGGWGQQTFPPSFPNPPAGQVSTASSPSIPPSARPALAVPAPPAAVFQPAETAARVGDQFIFMGELLGDANIMIALNTGVEYSELNEQRRSGLEFERQRLVKQLLQSAIERKLMYIEFLRSIPAEKMEEALATIDQRVGQTFHEKIFDMLDRVNTLPKEEYLTLIRQDARLFRVAYLMKQRELSSLAQLDVVLRANGSTLDKQKSAYAERILGQQQMRDSIDADPEITHAEMAAYYQDNLSEFQVPARAKWRQISIRFNLCQSKEQAGEMIAALGNELALGGAPFWAVAKRSSHGPNKDEGGLHDWTDAGNLELTQQVAAEVFTIPLNELSRIIRDAEGLHIVKVLDRTEAHLIPFAEAQVAIKRSLQNQKRSESIEKYLKGLRKRTPIWKGATNDS